MTAPTTSRGRTRSTEEPTAHVPRRAPFDWRSQAVCLDEDPETFHPLGVDWEGDAALKRLDVAKSICARCPVRQTCRDDGIARRDEWAVLGGLSPRGRSNYVRAQARRIGGES